ncbi:IS701 family transposase [Tepidibacter formicigenes]|jgi:hypothetical protein|uniref:DDE superfamily endonuclease n=3 Tax=Tepidibacter formicigenes DSM 15518 TaxID=1123349 RepID=A0A1M6UFZ3_9FIRM|nr:transposase [Tepidibacter formicigenes]SHK68063.1 DDE superfamily endonuclease [Tepidibacter formicigenes DSM 15518]
MIIDDKSTLKTLKKYLFLYRDIFYKRSFELFVLTILAIITMQKVQSIKYIYEKFISKYWSKSLNSFYYFLNNKNYCIDDIMRVTARIGVSLIPLITKENTSIYLSIDDTLQPKFGDKFEHRYKLFDHAKHNGNSFMNGHCIVSMTMSIPMQIDNGFKYITIPIGYKVYDKSCTKLELAKNLISIVMPELKGLQVVVLCDSWYTKKPFLQIIKDYDNLEIIGALRSDTVLYDLKPAPTGKRGRPRIKGDRLNYREFDYTKESEFYIATVECITNLSAKPVIITVTTKDINTFSSVRLYLSTIKVENVKTKYNKNTKDEDSNIYGVYKMRWNIEVMFYQQKLFWSLGTYMVRSKISIEKYINLIGVAYSAMILLPFISATFKAYRFCSPQEAKHIIGEAIREELFFSKLLKIHQIKKNLSRIPYLRQYANVEDLAS